MNTPPKSPDPADIEELGLDPRKLNRALDIAKTQVFMGKNAAFLGSLLCSLEFVWTDDIDTAATDGVHLYFSPTFFQSLTPTAREFVLMHELWHVGFMHVLRQGSRCPDYWNQACDYVINNKLQDEGYNLDVGFPVLVDRQYDNMSAEEVYDLIFPKNPPPFPQPQTGAIPGNGTTGMGRDILPVTDKMKQDSMNKVVQAVQATRMGGKNAGSIPGEIEAVIEAYLRPKVDWTTLFDRFFNEMSYDDWTWARPNRRYQDIYLPSKGGDGRLDELNYYLDVSGSVNDDQVLRFNSEVRNVKERYNPRKLNLILFDTQIQQTYTFTEDDVFEKIVVTGRGGTSFHCVRDHIEETKPTAAVIFSDMYCGPMPPVDTPVIWVAIDNRNATVPFGKIIHIED